MRSNMTQEIYVSIISTLSQSSFDEKNDLKSVENILKNTKKIKSLKTIKGLKRCIAIHLD